MSSEWFITGRLLAKIEFWSKQYTFSFQFWGEGNNNVFIDRDSVEVHSTGGMDTIKEVLEEAIEWCEKANPSKKYPKGIEITNPQP